MSIVLHHAFLSQYSKPDNNIPRDQYLLQHTCMKCLLQHALAGNQVCNAYLLKVHFEVHREAQRWVDELSLPQIVHGTSCSLVHQSCNEAAMHEPSIAAAVRTQCRNMMELASVIIPEKHFIFQEPFVQERCKLHAHHASTAVNMVAL